MSYRNFYIARSNRRVARNSRAPESTCDVYAAHATSWFIRSNRMFTARKFKYRNTQTIKEYTFYIRHIIGEGVSYKNQLKKRFRNIVPAGLWIAYFPNVSTTFWSAIPKCLPLGGIKYYVHISHLKKHKIIYLHTRFIRTSKIYRIDVSPLLISRAILIAPTYLLELSLREHQ